MILAESNHSVCGMRPKHSKFHDYSTCIFLRCFILSSFSNIAFKAVIVSICFASAATHKFLNHIICFSVPNVLSLPYHFLTHGLCWILPLILWGLRNYSIITLNTFQFNSTIIIRGFYIILTLWNFFILAYVPHTYFETCCIFITNNVHSTSLEHRIL